MADAYRQVPGANIIDPMRSGMGGAMGPDPASAMIGQLGATNYTAALEDRARGAMLRDDQSRQSDDLRLIREQNRFLQTDTTRQRDFYEQTYTKQLEYLRQDTANEFRLQSAMQAAQIADMQTAGLERAATAEAGLQLTTSQIDLLDVQREAAVAGGERAREREDWLLGNTKNNAQIRNDQILMAHLYQMYTDSNAPVDALLTARSRQGASDSLGKYLQEKAAIDASVGAVTVGRFDGQELLSEIPADRAEDFAATIEKDVTQWEARRLLAEPAAKLIDLLVDVYSTQTVQSFGPGVAHVRDSLNALGWPGTDEVLSDIKQLYKETPNKEEFRQKAADYVASLRSGYTGDPAKRRAEIERKFREDRGLHRPAEGASNIDAVWADNWRRAMARREITNPEQYEAMGKTPEGTAMQREIVQEVFMASAGSFFQDPTLQTRLNTVVDAFLNGKPLRLGDLQTTAAQILPLVVALQRMSEQSKTRLVSGIAAGTAAKILQDMPEVRRAEGIYNNEIGYADFLHRSSLITEELVAVNPQFHRPILVALGNNYMRARLLGDEEGAAAIRQQLLELDVDAEPLDLVDYIEKGLPPRLPREDSFMAPGLYGETAPSELPVGPGAAAAAMQLPPEEEILGPAGFLEE